MEWMLAIVALICASSSGEFKATGSEALRSYRTLTIARYAAAVLISAIAAALFAAGKGWLR